MILLEVVNLLASFSILFQFSKCWLMNEEEKHISKILSTYDRTENLCKKKKKKCPLVELKTRICCKINGKLFCFLFCHLGLKNG